MRRRWIWGSQGWVLWPLMGDVFLHVLLCYDDSDDDFPWSIMNGDVSFGYMLGMKAVEFVCLF
jgi:hypothetical protein